jgi:hypothetical protein
MERTEVLDIMGELKLYGMKAAYGFINVHIIYVVVVRLGHISDGWLPGQQ